MKLHDRMLEYEKASDYRLTRRTPVILRLDGKSFHTLARTLKLEKPFDKNFTNLMCDTCSYLVRNIQGAKFGYTQSDEISILLMDWKTFETEPWFNNRIQKMCSIAASMATMAFNKEIDVYFRVKTIEALFDCRAFNIPKEEVCNYFLFRQQDAIRNYYQAMGQHHFETKEIHGVSNDEIALRLKEVGVDRDNEHPFKIGTAFMPGKQSWSESFLFSEYQEMFDKLMRGQE